MSKLPPVGDDVPDTAATIFCVTLFTFVPVADTVNVPSVKLATPISNGGLILTPPGYFSGSARGGISQYHFYWLPPKEGAPTFFRPLVCHSLLVPECISVLFPRLHSLLSTHNTLLPRNVCLPILPDTLDACRKASGYSSLSDTT